MSILRDKVNEMTDHFVMRREVVTDADELRFRTQVLNALYVVADQLDRMAEAYPMTAPRAMTPGLQVEPSVGHPRALSGHHSTVAEARNLDGRHPIDFTSAQTGPAVDYDESEALS